MAVHVTVTAAGRAAGAELAVWREASALADRVVDLSRSIPPEDRDWLADPLRHAARSAAERIALGWRQRRQPAWLVDHLGAAEADLHEVQTWALLAVRHHHWSHEGADEIDRRCEAVLDTLAEMVHYAARWCGPAGPARAYAA